MLDVAQQPQLPVGPLGVDERLERPVKLLDGHLLLGDLVDGGAEGEQDAVHPNWTHMSDKLMSVLNRNQHHFLHKPS